MRNFGVFLLAVSQYELTSDHRTLLERAKKEEQNEIEMTKGSLKSGLTPLIVLERR